jgi:hypothetical protein
MSALPMPLKTEMEVFEKHRLEWIRDHHDQFAVIKERSLLGFFNEFHDAYRAGIESFGDGEFLVKRVVAQEPVFVVF